MRRKVVAIVGTYRKSGMSGAAVEAVLEAARESGAETHTIYLTEHPIEFCTNCRECMQQAGVERGRCVQHDGLEPILEEIETADAIVLGSPVNCGDVTAIFRRFMERLVGFGYWPWGRKAPVARMKTRRRKAVFVATSAMPGFLIPVATGAGKALRMTADLLGAHPVGRLWIGLAAMEPHQPLPSRARKRARRLGRKLAA